eukprot:scaffold3173_cov242-Pinguiococcus_pyrenoidosus.AAC.4
MTPERLRFAHRSRVVSLLSRLKASSARLKDAVSEENAPSQTLSRLWLFARLSLRLGFSPFSTPHARSQAPLHNRLHLPPDFRWKRDAERGVFPPKTRKRAVQTAVRLLSGNSNGARRGATAFRARAPLRASACVREEPCDARSPKSARSASAAPKMHARKDGAAALLQQRAPLVKEKMRSSLQSRKNADTAKVRWGCRATFATFASFAKICGRAKGRYGCA